MGSSDVPKYCQQHDKWIKMEDVHAVVASIPSYQNILFSDAKTNLMDFISSMKTLRRLGKFLQTIPDIDTALPDDSPLWPGSTPLHLAVMFSENKTEDAAANLIRQLLNQGASVQVQNSQGATPLHLAFRLEKRQMVALLLLRLFENESATNLLDNENLSHLHIACAASDHRNVSAKKLLKQPGIESTINVAYNGKALDNIKPEWTPLHVAVDLRRVSLVQSLLDRGASTTCRDAQGYTALHRLFGTAEEAKPLADVLFRSKQLKACETDNVGLTHLHVALWFGDDEAVKRLLDMEANIEARINRWRVGSDLEKFAGCTPLGLAMILGQPTIVRTLLQRGANLLANDRGGTTLLSRALAKSPHSITKEVLQSIESDDKLQKRLEEQMGVTMLHIACYRFDVKLVEAALKKGNDVNARVHERSNFWSGYTPLHVLLSTVPDRDWPRSCILRKLVKYGCDVNRQESTGKTAFQLTFALHDCYYHEHDILELLSSGVDLNIVDRSGKSTITYALELYPRCEKSYQINRVNTMVFQLLLHMYKMKFVGIEVSEHDQSLAMTALRSRNVLLNFPRQSAFSKELQATEKVKIGKRDLNLRSFLCETGAISRYPSLTPEDRLEVAAFFQSFDYRSFLHVGPLFRLQYSKAVARLSLIDPARDALKSFISPNFPDLCVDIILKYLSNSQLKQLIAASAEDNDM